MDLEPTGILPAATAAVTGAIRSAAQLTGASFQYLLATARVESKLNPQAAAPTSTARGPFQFIEQTWLATLKEEGPALGYSRYADAIARTPSGRYEITDPQLIDPILNLRTDPKTSAAMAGAFAKANTAKLTAWIGRPPTEGELYLAHFMGPSGAARLIGYVETQPQLAAADVFPLAAKANPAIFVDRQNKPRSVTEVYRALIGRFDAARATPGVPVTQIAAIAPPPRPTTATIAMPAMTPVTPSAALASADVPVASPPPARPATAQVAKAYADTGRIAAPKTEAIPVFHSLFLTVERAKPVSATVTALWGAPSAQPAPPMAAPAVHAPPRRR